MSAKRSTLKPLSQSNNKRRRPQQRRLRSDDSSDDDILWKTNLSKPKPSGEQNKSRMEMATTGSPNSSTRTSARSPSRVSYSPNIELPRNDEGNRTHSTQKKESPTDTLHDNNSSSDEVDEQQSVASDDTEALMKRIMVNKVTNTTSTPTLRRPGEDTVLGSNSIPSDSINDSQSPFETDHTVRHPTSELTATASNVEHLAKEEQPRHHVSKDDNDDDGNDDKSNTTAEPEHDNDQSSVDTAVLMGRLLNSHGGPTKSAATLEQDSVAQTQARLSAIPEARRQPEVEPFVPHGQPTQPPLLDTTNPPLVDDDYVLPEMSDDSSISSSSSDESENDQPVEKTIVQTTSRQVNDLTANKSEARKAPIPSSSRQNRANPYTASQPQYPSNTGHSTLERTIPPANAMAQGSGSANNDLGNEIRDTPQGAKRAVRTRPTVHNPYLKNHSSTSPAVHNPYLKHHSNTSPAVHNPYLKNHSSTSPALQTHAIPKKSTPCAAVDAKVRDEATVMDPATEPCPSWLDDDQLAEVAFLGTDTPSEPKSQPQEGATRTVRQGLRSPAPTFQVGRIRRSLEQHRAQVFGQNDDIEEVLEDDMEAEAFGFSAETAIEVDDPSEIQQPMIASHDRSSSRRPVHDGNAENRHSWPPTNSIQNNRPRLPIPEEWSTSNKRRKIRDPKATNIALASSAVGWSTTASPTPPVPQPPLSIHGSTGPSNQSEYQQITLTTNSLSTQRNDLRGGSGVGAGQYQIVNSYNDEEEDVWNAPPARSSSRGRGKRGRGGGRSQRSGRGRGRGGRGRGRGGRGPGGRTGGRNSSFRGRGSGNAWSDYGQTSPWTSRSTTDNSMIGHVGGAEISF